MNGPAVLSLALLTGVGHAVENVLTTDSPITAPSLATVTAWTNRADFATTR